MHGHFSLVQKLMTASATETKHQGRRQIRLQLPKPVIRDPKAMENECYDRIQVERRADSMQLGKGSIQSLHFLGDLTVDELQ